MGTHYLDEDHDCEAKCVDRNILKVRENQMMQIPLVEPVTKAVEKTIDGIGAFLGAICMPAAEEFGLLLRDRVTAFRLRNLQAIAEKTQAKMRDRQVQASGDANPLLLKAIIEDASWQEDDVIQQMWAGLLAVAAGDSAATDDSLIYSDTIKRLTPFQARFLQLIYGDPRICSRDPNGYGSVMQIMPAAFFPTNPLTYRAEEILSLYPGDLRKFAQIAVDHCQILNDPTHHVLALMRFRPQFEGLVNMGLINRVNFSKLTTVIPTLKGLDLYMRGLGYKVYPAEAFLLTLREWCKQRGVDPDTHRKE
jgi:hypothetical protein